MASPKLIDLETSHALDASLFALPKQYAGDVTSVLIPNGLVQDRCACVTPCERG